MGLRFGHNSTIGVKQKRCASCGKPCFWFSKKRCKDCATRESVFDRMERDLESSPQDDGLMDLIKQADDVVSQYVRMSGADENGLCKCYTCPTILPYSQMQAGHFIPRANLHLRFDISRNIRIQCRGCNEYKSGNIAIYSDMLNEEREGLPDILREESYIMYKPSREEIRQVILEYSGKVKLLKKRFGK